MASHEEDKFELGTNTMKRLNEMHGRDGITRKDIKLAREAGMSEEEIQKQYNEHIAAGGRVQQGAQARMEGMRTYDSLDDFHHDHISGHNLNPDRKKPSFDVSGSEMVNLLKNNKFDPRKVNEMVKERNLSLGNRAQHKLNEALSKLGSETPTDITDPGDGTPVIDTTPPMEFDQFLPTKSETPGSGDSTPAPSPTPTPTQKSDMDLTQNLIQGNDKFNNSPVTNTFGDDASFYGNYTGGNVDMSINIGGQTGSQGSSASGGNGAMNLGGGGLDNLASGAATMGLLENTLARQNQMFSASGRAKSTIDAAARDTGITDRLNKLNYVYDYPSYNENKARQMEARTFGDLDAFGVPDWANTADPEKYDLDDLEKTADKYKI